MCEATLWEVLQRVPDHRGRKGRQYSLVSVLAISLAAMLAGRDSLAGIFRWGRRLRPKALEELGIGVGRAPCHATYHYVFHSLAVDDLEAALGAWVQDDAALGHVAIDGKSLRGSRDCGVSAVHLLAAFCTRLQAVVGELRVPPDGNEITAALKLLKTLPLQGAIISGDAIFAQRKICQHIVAQGGDYFFAVKANQPRLLADIALAFGDIPPLRRASTAS